PYVPGWDCHRLPINYKVVKQSRDLSPLEVRKRCDAFARKYVDLQRGQFKRLGVLGDWEHPYLTLDPKYEAEILRAFAVFVEKGLVYQSKKPVFWSTGAQTPLASRPGAKIAKIKARHPFLDREAIVLTADFVAMDTGTGAVHIAPGHGEDDYWLGKQHDLPILSPVDDHGRLTDEAGLPNLTGKYVFDANADIVNLLRERGNLLGVQNFHHSYPYCWRSKTPIIFRNVEQFFIRIDDLRGQALKAIHNEVKWITSWGENRIAR